MIPAEAGPRQPPNAVGARRRALLALGDRRFHRRYPITAELEYRAVGEDGRAVQGSGRCLNLSTGGVLFETGEPLEAGMRVELAIAWPVRLNDSLALNLRVSGRISRSSGTSHGVRIREHEFCLRGRYRVAGPRFQTLPASPASVAASAG
jgi:hypothetical protein